MQDGPDFIACAFNGVDGYSHEKHPHAPKVIESYRTVDRAIGEARRWLRENGRGAFDNLDDDSMLRRSFESTHPDAPMQLAQIFRAERSGDVVVSAKRGYDLRARWEVPEHRSTHGALVPAQMHVPVIISTPVMADNFRTADVFPTVLRLMGGEPAGGIDGVARS